MIEFRSALVGLQSLLQPAIVTTAKIAALYMLIQWTFMKPRVKDSYEAAWLAIAWCAVAYIAGTR